MADLLNGLYWEMGAYRVHFPTGACFHLPSTLKQQKHRIKFANQMQLFTLVMNIEHLNKLTGISWNSLSSASFTNAFITHNSHHVFIIHSVFTADSKLHFYILQFAHKTIVYSRYNEISCRTNRNETKKNPSLPVVVPDTSTIWCSLRCCCWNRQMQITWICKLTHGQANINCATRLIPYACVMCIRFSRAYFSFVLPRKKNNFSISGWLTKQLSRKFFAAFSPRNWFCY